MAGEWAGFKTVGQCEWADYQTKVLEKHWPDVPRWRDIRSVTSESFKERTGLHTVTLVSGGFPCQPFSTAGNRRGKEDDRYLWPEMLRAIQELQPTWVLGENVAGIISMGEPAPVSVLENDNIGSTEENMVLEEICQAIQNIGYEVQPVLIPACSVGAPHQRYRTFIVGYSKHNGLSATKITGSISEASNYNQEGKNKASQLTGTNKSRNSTDVANTAIKGLEGNARGIIQRELRRLTMCSENVSNPNCERFSSGRCKQPAGREIPFNCNTLSNTSGQRLQRQGKFIESMHTEANTTGETSEFINVCIRNQWSTEPNVGRVANGVPARVDRLKCLGNAVVPQQVYPILQAIADVERGCISG